MCSSPLRLKLYFVKGRRDPLHSGHGVLLKANTRFVSTQQHRFDLGGPAQYSEYRDVEEGCRRFGKGAKPVPYLGLQPLDLAGVSHVSEAAVDVELRVLARHVLVGHV